jgi:hypothetical protein
METGLTFPDRNERVTTEGGTQRIEASAYWMAVWAGRWVRRQIRVPPLRAHRDARGRAALTGQANCFEGLPRKASKGVFVSTVSQSDTGRQGE